MKKIILSIAALIVTVLIAYLWYCNSDQFYKIHGNSSCSTFLLNENDTILVGHNLDDYIEVPGAIFINKSGVLKENISWTDFTCICAKKKSNPRIQWTSKYGSVTYNTWGKEFIDGGMNEEGLYIGEMTMIGTKWSETENPAFHHHFFMQYILDNFKTVQEAVDNMSNIKIDGHCQWHYFLADKTGNTAIFEFIDGQLKLLYKDNEMPIKVLCNRAYQKELNLIPENDSIYNEMIETEYVSKDLRFMLASKMINGYNPINETSLVNYAFSILKKMDMGNNKWSIVYDLKKQRMFFRSSLGQEVKFIDFNSFDFECNTPIKLFDINTDIAGDVSDKFVNYSVELNKQFIDKNFAHINFGFIGNLLFKDRYKNKINKYANSFDCENKTATNTRYKTLGSK